VAQVIFLSPHYDDVVLSCGSLLRRMIQEGESVLVVTIFTRNQSHRKRENARALEILGADHLDLDLFDAPERGVVKERKGRVLFGKSSEDPETLGHLIQCLHLLPPNAGKVFAPLGIGWHLDHLITHDAAKIVYGDKVQFYEDFPYNFSPAQKSLRFKDDQIVREEFKKEFFELQYVKSWLPDWTEADLLLRLRDLEICEEMVSTQAIAGCEEKIRALKSYESQIRFLFRGDEDLAHRIRGVNEVYYLMRRKPISQTETSINRAQADSSIFD
jgi:LmbE family N-acetylglucosaminyl deacetylase